MLLPLDMANNGVLLLVFLPIMCPHHLLPFPSLHIRLPIFLYNIILQLLCYILLDILF